MRRTKIIGVKLYQTQEARKEFREEVAEKCPAPSLPCLQIKAAMLFGCDGEKNIPIAFRDLHLLPPQ